jgi:hypothetical protein
VRGQTAFAALKEKMRFFRDRYFKLPPLTEEDWAALGFRPKVSHTALFIHRVGVSRVDHAALFPRRAGISQYQT